MRRTSAFPLFPSAAADGFTLVEMDGGHGGARPITRPQLLHFPRCLFLTLQKSP